MNTNVSDTQMAEAVNVDIPEDTAAISIRYLDADGKELTEAEVIGTVQIEDDADYIGNVPGTDTVH